MIYISLIDTVNKKILYDFAYASGDTEAPERYRGLSAQAELMERDEGGKYEAYRGDKPFEFLPETVEEVAEAMSVADTSGVDATL